jgi:hypothetical protein
MYHDFDPDNCTVNPYPLTDRRSKFVKAHSNLKSPAMVGRNTYPLLLTDLSAGYNSQIPRPQPHRLLIPRRLFYKVVI